MQLRANSAGKAMNIESYGKQDINLTGMVHFHIYKSRPKMFQNNSTIEK